MKALVDAAFPASIEQESPPEVEYARWVDGDKPDSEFIRLAAEMGCSAAVLYGRHALLQPSVTELARELGIVVLAVDAKDPIEAKGIVFRNTRKILHAVARGQSAVINASGVHSADDVLEVRKGG